VQEGAVRLSLNFLPMSAARPTAWSALSVTKLFKRSSDAMLPGGVHLRIFNPADKLVAAQRRQALPQLTNTLFWYERFC